MASRSVYFFGDASQETNSGLRRVLSARRDGTVLSLFLDLASSALQYEVSQLSLVDRKELPDFHDLHNLVQDDFDESKRHPALHPTEVVLTQLAHFIASAYPPVCLSKHVSQLIY